MGTPTENSNRPFQRFAHYQGKQPPFQGTMLSSSPEKRSSSWLPGQTSKFDDRTTTSRSTTDCYQNFQQRELVERQDDIRPAESVQSDGPADKISNNRTTPSVKSQPAPNCPIHRQLAVITNPEHAKLLSKLNLCREVDRLLTFTDLWPRRSAPLEQDMAASGWFFLGNLDRTQCFSCGGVLRNWRRLDNPHTEHTTHFPHCSMAQGRENRNIPNKNFQPAPSTFNTASNRLSEERKSNLQQTFPCLHPATPSMLSVQERERTFFNWCFTRAPPRVLAEAGFFSLAIRDRVRCHYCHGGLQNWKQNDDPWVEHAMWYPNCAFLLQKRGPEFIHKIVAKFPNINRPILRSTENDRPSLNVVQSGPSDLSSCVRRRPNNNACKNVKSKAELLETAMNSEIAITVMGLGFDETMVREVMTRNIQQFGVAYQTATALLDAVTGHRGRTLEITELELLEVPKASSAFVLTQNVESFSENEDLYGSINVDHSKEHFSSFASVVPCSSTSPSRIQQTSVCKSYYGTEITHASKQKSTTEKIMKDLQKTLRELEEEKLCKVCLCATSDMVFIPCGHISFCMECTRQLRICPICRTRIEKAVRTYTYENH